MRKSQAKKHVIIPDPKFGDPMVTRFVNTLMWEGKKSVAFRIFYDSLEQINKATNEDGYEIWKKAIHNLTPTLEVKSRRIGGATFQIPSEVRPDRKISLSMKWLISYSRARNGKSMSEKLAAETLAASKGEGAAYKKKEDTHRMAEANKAFSHYKA